MQAELEHEILELKQQLHEIALVVACPYEDMATKGAVLTFKCNSEEDTPAYKLSEEYAEIFHKEFDVQYITRVNPSSKERVLCIKGNYAFAILHSEAGMHNILMPSTKKGLRVIVEVTPYIETEVVHHNTDFRVDVYRSLGASCLGSHYVDSSIRITHLPSGIVVESSGEKASFEIVI